MAVRNQTGALRWRDARVILAVTLICTLAALAMSYTVRREYQAAVRVSIVPAQLEKGTAGALRDLVRNYAAQIEYANYARSVGVRAAAEPDKLLIRVSAAHQDPLVAGQLAQNAAARFVEERTAFNLTREQQERIEVSLLDSVPQIVPSHPRLATDAFGGSLLGAAGVTSILILRRRLRREGRLG